VKEIKLMLVDDEERFLSTTKKLIEKKGIEVLTAQSGGEAINILSNHTVHVVILDVKMPGLDGISTLKWIKQLHPLTEVIMLTGHATVESAIEGLKAGAYDYLTKPVDIHVLVEMSEDAYLKRRNLEEKIRMAQARTLMKTPRDITKQAGED
jgi:DNA-binding NtrC family response regulator